MLKVGLGSCTEIKAKPTSWSYLCSFDSVEATSLNKSNTNLSLLELMLSVPSVSVISLVV
jgi:hypothetical protein